MDPLWEIVAVEKVASPFFLQFIDTCLFTQHLSSPFIAWSRRYVTEFTTVSATGSDVDHIVAKALLIQVRLTNGRLSRISIHPNSSFLFCIGCDCALPAEEVSTGICGESTSDLC
jgi:hypothetical protein